MRTLSRNVILAATALFLALIIPAVAGDLGNPKDVQEVRKVVAKKFGKALHASVSHDWALCTAYADENDVSVVLHRTGSNWKVAGNDGGAYAAGTLKALGVPPADIPSLLKAYQ